MVLAYTVHLLCFTLHYAIVSKAFNKFSLKMILRATKTNGKNIYILLTWVMTNKGSWLCALEANRLTLGIPFQLVL